MKNLLVIIERWTLPVLVSISLILFCLTIGEKMGAGLAKNSIEAGVQALTLDSAETGFTLYMNFAINMTFAWAALKIFMASLGLRLDNLLVRKFSRSHVVIVAGFSWRNKLETGRFNQVDFARDLAISASKNHNVVIALPQIEDDQRTLLWELGVRVVTYRGDPTATLNAAGISRADFMFAVCDNPVDNLTLSRAALSPSTKNKTLQTRCLVEPLHFKRALKLEEYFEDNSISRLRLFNQSELIARKILSQFPPDISVANSDERVHVLVLGMTSITEATILQFARIGHYKNNQKPKITIVGLDTEKRLIKLHKDFPSLTEWLDIDHIDRSMFEISVGTLSELINREGAPIIGYITGLVEMENLRMAKILVAAITTFPDQHKLKNFKVIAIDPPGGTIITDYFTNGQHNDRIHVFSLFGSHTSKAKSVIARSLLSDLDDRIGQEIHDAYRQNDLNILKKNPGHKLHPNSVEWSALPENIRNANRAVADHLDIKLRALGLELSEEDDLENIQLSENQIEILAVMEHRRWWADRSLSGWRFAEIRNDNKLHHPNMVPYEELSEEDKQKDRDSVLKIIDIVRRGKKKLVKMG